MLCATLVAFKKTLQKKHAKANKKKQQLHVKIDFYVQFLP
jgi:hypothetical protein